MTWSSFKYLIKEGFRSIVSNRMMSVASILVLIACMLLIGASILFTLNVNSVVDYMVGQNEMLVFLNDDLDELIKNNIEAKLKEISSVESIVYVSKEEGFEEYLNSLGDKAHDILGDLLENQDPPANDAFEVILNDPSKMREVQVLMENTSGVEDVYASTEVAETLINLKNGVMAAGTIIVGILIVVSMVLTANTIKLTVYNRRKEINIMKYVGATDMFIRLPFVVEGIIIGIFAALLSILITWGYYTFIIDKMAQWNAGGWLTAAMGSLIPFSDVVYRLSAYFLIGGIVIGIISSVIFVRKHLKV